MAIKAWNTGSERAPAAQSAQSVANLERQDRLDSLKLLRASRGQTHWIQYRSGIDRWYARTLWLVVPGRHEFRRARSRPSSVGTFSISANGARDFWRFEIPCGSRRAHAFKSWRVGSRFTPAMRPRN